MIRTLPSIPAILFFLALAAPAEACWPWCKKGAPSGNVETVELAVTSQVSSTSPTVALQIASTSPAITLQSPSTSPNIDTMQRWGISDAEARRAFNMAYEHSDFKKGMGEAYGLWLQSIGDVNQNSGYVFGMPGNFIRATDSGGVGVWQLDMESSFNSDAAIESGQQFGAERDTLRGLFARALVALGGRDGIDKIVGVYSLEDVTPLVRQPNEDDLSVVARTDLGILTHDFLGFSPLHMNEAIQDVRFEVYYGRPRAFQFPPIYLPPLPDLSNDQTGPRLQIGIHGVDDRLEADNLDAPITSTIGLDDAESFSHGSEEKEELLRDTEKSSPRGSTEKNPLLD
jgi:hypothetical protein